MPTSRRPSVWALFGYSDVIVIVILIILIILGLVILLLIILILIISERKLPLRFLECFWVQAVVGKRCERTGRLHW